MSYVNKTNNLFPSANVVYLDNDYLNLRAKGLLAYNNLQDAIEAFSAGGAAAVKFGTPSATNPCAILIGVGTFETHRGAVSYFINTDYISIIGQGKEVSILTSAYNLIGKGPMIDFNVENHILRDFQVLGTANTQCLLREAGGSAFPGQWINLKIVGYHTDSSSSATIQGISLTGRIIDCDFDGTNSTGGSLFSFGGSNDTGNIEGCRFLCSSSNIAALIYSGTNLQGDILNCTFRGNINGPFFSAGGAVDSYSGTIANCDFESVNVCSSIGIQANGGAFNQCLIHSCNFLTGSNCIQINSGERVRIVACNLASIQNSTNVDAILIKSGSTGCSISNCRIVGNGTGLAIKAEAAVTCAITNCALRMPNGDVAGSSISSNITNNASMAFNAELLSATQL
jgi:hypothetical protein